MRAPVHPDDDLFRIERDMPRHHRKDLCPQQSQQFRLTAQAAFMRQQYLQPFPCDGRGSRAATDESKQIHYAALRPSNLFMKLLRGAGTVMLTFSPIRRRTASV